MDGVIPKLGIGAVRIDSDIVTWPKQGNAMRRVKVPAANGRYVGLVLLFSSETGEPLAILPDGVMQRIRVGATNGLGVKYLARENASSIGILGSGWQAGAQLAGGLRGARDQDASAASAPTASHREAFAREMSALLGIAVEPVAQPEDAIGGADIVMCATNSIDNVFFARWIEPGMHLSSIKLPEIERAAIERADRLVIHTHDAKPLHVTTRGARGARARRQQGLGAGQGIDFSKAPTLADLIAGKAEAAARRAR